MLVPQQWDLNCPRTGIDCKQHQQCAYQAKDLVRNWRVSHILIDDMDILPNSANTHCRIQSVGHFDLVVVQGQDVIGWSLKFDAHHVT